MPSFSLSVLVTRTQLGLADLQVNDNVNYKMSGNDFMNGQVTYERETVRSPYVEGEFTTNRRRSNVREQVAFDVFPGNSTGISGVTKYALEANIQQLIAAFTQDAFIMTIVANSGTTWQQEWYWACEAADYAVSMTGPRFIARQGIVAFSLIRNPVPTNLTWSSW
jgi:hypothetical protein